MAEQKKQRSRVMGGAEDDIITDHPAELHDPALSSRTKDETFADAPRDSAPVPERHDHSSHEKEAADATFFQADYSAEETNKKGGDA